MSIKMSVGSAIRQKNGISNLVTSQNKGYSQLESSLHQFISNTPNLRGITYDSAKSYVQEVLSPLTKGCILLNEAVSRSSEDYVSGYLSKLGMEDLDSKELEDQILRCDQQIKQLNLHLNWLYSEKKPDYSAINRVNSQITLLSDTRHKLYQKLQDLHAFNHASVTYFSDLDFLYQNVKKGLSQAQLWWQPSSQSFVKPYGQDNLWAGVLNAKWEEKGKIQVKSQDIIDYLTANGMDISLTMSLDSAISFVDELAAEMSRLGISINQLGSAINEMSQEFSHLKSIFTQLMRTVKTGDVSTVVKLPVSDDSIGQRILNFGNKIDDAGRNLSKASKVLGGTLTIGGLGLGVYDDMANNDKTFSQAVLHNAASYSVGAVVAFALFGSNPVGWAIVAAVAVATIASTAFEFFYQNNSFGIQDKLDTIGSWFDELGDSISGKKIYNPDNPFLLNDPIA